MNYLLDTNICIAILNERPPHIQDHLKSVLKGGHSVNVSVVTAFELWFGAYRSQRFEHNSERLIHLLSRFESLEFDEEDAVVAARLRAELAQLGTPIGPFDLLIAAHAVRRNFVLVTNNFREFKRIPELHFEDWISGAAS